MTNKVIYDYFVYDNSYTLTLNNPEQSLICDLCHSKMQLFHTGKSFEAKCYNNGNSISPRRMSAR